MWVGVSACGLGCLDDTCVGPPGGPNAPAGAREGGWRCLDVRTYRPRDSISRRAKRTTALKSSSAAALACPHDHRPCLDVSGRYGVAAHPGGAKHTPAANDEGVGESGCARLEGPPGGPTTHLGDERWGEGWCVWMSTARPLPPSYPGGPTTHLGDECRHGGGGGHCRVPVCPVCPVCRGRCALDGSLDGCWLRSEVGGAGVGVPGCEEPSTRETHFQAGQRHLLVRVRRPWRAPPAMSRPSSSTSS